MGLDFEMAINQHYFEVLDVVEDLFDTVFNGLATQYSEMAVEHFILLDKLMF